MRKKFTFFHENKVCLETDKSIIAHASSNKVIVSVSRTEPGKDFRSFFGGNENKVI